MSATTEINKTTVGRMFDEVVNLRKLDVVDELFDPDFQTLTPVGTMDLDGFRGFVAAWQAGFSDLVCDVDDLVAEGDRVAWRVRARGTHTGEFMGIPATGRSVDFDSLNIGEFRDGRAYRHQVIMDMATMMAQLGAGPAAP